MKSRIALAVFLASGTSLGYCQVLPEAMVVVRQFLSPGASLPKVEAYSSSGVLITSTPAVIKYPSAPGKADIAYAETTTIGEGPAHSLLISVLQAQGSKYQRVFSKTYYSKMLWSQGFKTIGFQQVNLSPTRTGLLVITSIGASLGGDLEIFT